MTEVAVTTPGDNSTRRTWPVVIVALALGALIGLLGLSFLFSDLGPGETEFARDASTIGLYVLGGLVLGALARRRWYVATVLPWGAILVGLANLVLRGSLSVLMQYTLPALAISLGASFVGYKLRMWVSRRSGERLQNAG